MVTILEVRNYLNALPAELVNDESVRVQIELAIAEVNKTKSKIVLSSDLDNAVLALAGYKTYLAYVTRIERGEGAIPAPMLTHLADLKQISDSWLSYVKRGAPEVKSPIALSKTIWKGEKDWQFL